MNKTLKTIAWICLVLGLIGVALDVGAFVYGRTLFNGRREQFAQLQEKINEEDFPLRGRFCLTEDEDGEVALDEDCLSNRKAGFFSMGGNQFDRPFRGGPSMRNSSSIAGRGMVGGFIILPFLFLASGPVLAVIGAVILLVNREPKLVKAKEGKKKAGKK